MSPSTFGRQGGLRAGHGFMRAICQQALICRTFVNGPIAAAETSKMVYFVLPQMGSCMLCMNIDMQLIISSGADEDQSSGDDDDKFIGNEYDWSFGTRWRELEYKRLDEWLVQSSWTYVKPRDSSASILETWTPRHNSQIWTHSLFCNCFNAGQRRQGTIQWGVTGLRVCPLHLQVRVHNFSAFAAWTFLIRKAV